MALKGLDIFKLTPKTNCKECGCPTCMAFSMKVAQGALPIEKCPHMSSDAMAALSEATAPPMKTIKVGTGEAEYSLGGETVLYRHEKTFVSKTRYAVRVNAADVDAKMAVIDNVDYDRIGERMHVEMVYVDYTGEADYAETVKKVVGKGKTIILGCTDVAAAKAAHIHPFIMRLPMGYETVISEDGGNISKGQKQLLTIARAMLYNAKMLILDEATSNVDTSTEREIQKAMRELMKDKTCFVIAHRLSTIQNADKILVVDHGDVVEQGAHEELIKKQGFYFKLYKAQFE